MTYLPIEDYGLIGNMRTVALVGKNGAIDWFCTPHFDSPSVFAALLDDTKGGRYQLAPADAMDDVTCKQFYWPDTNVLVTRFLTPTGIGAVVDYMPVGRDADAGRLIRQATVISGTVDFRLTCEPAFNYARDQHTVAIRDEGALFSTEALQLGLASPLPLTATERGATVRFTLRQDETRTFTLQPIHDGQAFGLTEAEAAALFEETVTYWHGWLRQCTYTGRWQEHVYRSALVLKLMQFEPTGALVAAPTCSLPERVGGARNWDYRYVWLRDAAFTVYAFMRIGFNEEAERFMDWLTGRCYNVPQDGVPLQPVYRIDGSSEIREFTLDHLEGYRRSGPVRVGNAAYGQVQMDIYGEVMDSVYLYNKHGQFISHELWERLRRVIDWLCDNWRTPDLGIWEFRSQPDVFVYSRVMCWVAFARAIRIADKRAFPADRERWRSEMDAIYEEVMARGYNEEIGAFTQRYDDSVLDAASLLMPLVFFVSASDPRMKRTVDAIMRSPDSGGLTVGSMVYRYNIAEAPDGLQGEQGAFNMCTFWLVEALTRGRRVDEARLVFERMLTNANHLGLFAEETGKRGQALGNYPQAFTHLSLISAAVNLDRALGSRV
ncbi:MAG: glycoside hydrolase family 15 protein [Chloroflexota bacterium]